MGLWVILPVVDPVCAAASLTIGTKCHTTLPVKWTVKHGYCGYCAIFLLKKGTIPAVAHWVESADGLASN